MSPSKFFFYLYGTAVWDFANFAGKQEKNCSENDEETGKLQCIVSAVWEQISTRSAVLVSKLRFRAQKNLLKLAKVKVFVYLVFQTYNLAHPASVPVPLTYFPV